MQDACNAFTDSSPGYVASDAIRNRENQTTTSYTLVHTTSFPSMVFPQLNNEVVVEMSSSYSVKDVPNPSHPIILSRSNAPLARPKADWLKKNLQVQQTWTTMLGLRYKAL